MYMYVYVCIYIVAIILPLNQLEVYSELGLGLWPVL